MTSSPVPRPWPGTGRSAARHVAAALDALDRPTLFEVAARVPFSGGIESMTGFLLASALTQTAFHADLLGRADEVRPA